MTEVTKLMVTDRNSDNLEISKSGDDIYIYIPFMYIYIHSSIYIYYSVVTSKF